MLFGTRICGPAVINAMDAGIGVVVVVKSFTSGSGNPRILQKSGVLRVGNGQPVNGILAQSQCMCGTFVCGAVIAPHDEWALRDVDHLRVGGLRCHGPRRKKSAERNDKDCVHG